MSAEAKSSKGVAMYLSVGSVDPVALAPTAISKAQPTEVTCAAPTVVIKTAAPPPAPAPAAAATGDDTGGGTDAPAAAPPAPRVGEAFAFAMGQIIQCIDTGFAELDNRYFSIDTVTEDGFTMLGADTTDSTGALIPNPEMTLYDTSNMVRMCLNNFAFNLETPGTVAAGTYCNPTATLPSTPTSIGTATLGGWIDVDDPAYAELLKAEDDGEDRVFSIVLPQGQGEIVAALSITGVTWEIPLEGGMAFTATGNLSAKPRHLF